MTQDRSRHWSTRPATVLAVSDCHLISKFWYGRTICVKIVITTGRDCGRPSGSTRQESSMIHSATSQTRPGLKIHFVSSILKSRQGRMTCAHCFAWQWVGLVDQWSWDRNEQVSKSLKTLNNYLNLHFPCGSSTHFKYIHTYVPVGCVIKYLLKSHLKCNYGHRPLKDHKIMHNEVWESTPYICMNYNLVCPK